MLVARDGIRLLELLLFLLELLLLFLVNVVGVRHFKVNVFVARVVTSTACSSPPLFDTCTCFPSWKCFTTCLS